MNRRIENLLTWLFLWSGSKLFSTVIIPASDDDADELLAVHFGVSEFAVKQSMMTFLYGRADEEEYESDDDEDERCAQTHCPVCGCDLHDGMCPEGCDPDDEDDDWEDK